ncbi:Histone-lysine N-methyltransferase ASHR3 [Linum perenne]
MPDLGNATLRCSLPSPVAPPPDNELEEKNSPVKALVNGCNWNLNLRLQKGSNRCNRGLIRVLSRSRGGVASKKGCSAKCLEDYVNDWVQKKMEMGASSSQCHLPFLRGGKKMVECLVCHRCIGPEEELASCSVRNCGGVYHSKCAEEKFKFKKGTKFKCSQHTCFVCKQKRQFRCVRCLIAFHDTCAPWPIIHLTNQLGRAICWRHDDDWRLDKNDRHMVPTRDIEHCLSLVHICDETLKYVLNLTCVHPVLQEIFLRLPLPYVEEEFKIDLTWKGLMENKQEPPPYVHIRRTSVVKFLSLYMSTRVQCISCSKSCRCSENCTNRPFRKDKKIRIVKTELCGWGVEAAEPIKKGDFVIEYIGEVISDAQCEQRLWDMKYRGVHNFYMCEIRKDFTIDATFKGNTSRFLNHSCDPNCILEKWQVEGETRVGVFAARSIQVGDPLTYDYRFVQFGPEVKCYCGAANCQGYLGTKRKVTTTTKMAAELNIELNIYWGAKRRRSSSSSSSSSPSMSCLAIVAL